MQAFESSRELSFHFEKIATNACSHKWLSLLLHPCARDKAAPLAQTRFAWSNRAGNGLRNPLRGPGCAATAAFHHEPGDGSIPKKRSHFLRQFSRPAVARGASKPTSLRSYGKLRLR